METKKSSPQKEVKKCVGDARGPEANKATHFTSNGSPKVQTVYLSCIQVSEMDLVSLEEIYWLVQKCFKNGHNFQEWR